MYSYFLTVDCSLLVSGCFVIFVSGLIYMSSHFTVRITAYQMWWNDSDNTRVVSWELNNDNAVDDVLQLVANVQNYFAVWSSVILWC